MLEGARIELAAAAARLSGRDPKVERSIAAITGNAREKANPFKPRRLAPGREKSSLVASYLSRVRSSATSPSQGTVAFGSGRQIPGQVPGSGSSVLAESP